MTIPVMLLIGLVALVALQFLGQNGVCCVQPKDPTKLALDLGADFMLKVQLVCSNLGINPDWLMACMAFESGGTFSPSVRNRAGSGAVGLIQFMPSTARNLGTSTDALAAMTRVQQLDYVNLYMASYRGRMQTLADVYMAILYPLAIGKPDTYVLFSEMQTVTAYQENKGLDLNCDGVVTKAEASAKVAAILLAQGTYFLPPCAPAPVCAPDQGGVGADCAAQGNVQGGSPYVPCITGGEG